MTSGPTDPAAPHVPTPAEVDIDELLPQKRPFVMIDRLTHYDPVVTRTELTVRGDNLFAEDGSLSHYGLIENVAQTCAARMGYINLVSGLPVRLGYIGAVNDLVINRLPAVGETLQTSITVVSEVFSMTLVEAETRSGDEVILTSKMKIFLSDIDKSAE